MSDLPKKLRDASHPYRCIVGPDGETTLMELGADEIDRLITKTRALRAIINYALACLGNGPASEVERRLAAISGNQSLG